MWNFMGVEKIYDKKCQLSVVLLSKLTSKYSTKILHYKERKNGIVNVISLIECHFCFAGLLPP